MYTLRPTAPTWLLCSCTSYVRTRAARASLEACGPGVSDVGGRRGRAAGHVDGYRIGDDQGQEDIVKVRRHPPVGCAAGKVLVVELGVPSMPLQHQI